MPEESLGHYEIQKKIKIKNNFFFIAVKLFHGETRQVPFELILVIYINKYLSTRHSLGHRSLTKLSFLRRLL